MSQFAVFKERIEMRLKKFPQLLLSWNGQTAAVVRRDKPEGVRLRVNPGPRPCSVLLKIGDDAAAKSVEWMTLEAAFGAMALEDS